MSRLAVGAERAIGRSGLPWLIRRLIAKRRLSILVYHDPAPAVFERHVRYLGTRYTFVRLDDVIDALRGGSWAALPKYPLAVTFDDGWRGNRDLAEICRKYRCPITIYVCSQMVDTSRHYWWTETPDDEELKRLPTAKRLEVLRESGFDHQRDYPDRQSLDRAEAAEMIDIADFGSHTRFHPILTMCTGLEAEREIALSKDEVEAFSSRPCIHFAYPNGDFTDREIQYLSRAGYSSARTNDAGWNDHRVDPFRLRASGIPDDASTDRLAAYLAGISFVWRWRLSGKWDGRHPAVEPAGEPGGTSA